MPYGKKKLSVNIPDKNVLTIIKHGELKPTLSSEKIIKNALSHPIGAKRLKELGSKKAKIALVVDDVTRPCPTSKILPPLLEELNVPRENIKVIFACGTHEPVNEKEAQKLLGVRLKHTSSSTKNASEFEYVGTTSRKTQVKLNKNFLDADLKILVGDVELHYFAGYGGGRKSILPGISSNETIQNNHKLMFNENCRLGNLENNPVHLDMLEAYELAEVDFLINVVQNPSYNIISAYAGEHSAFYRCTEIVDKLYKVKLEVKPDIVLAAADGYPHDIDFYQAIKAIQTVIDVIKKDGVLILVGECPQGHGSDIFYKAMQKYTSSEEVKEALLKDFVMGRHKVYYLLKALEKVDIILVSNLDRAMVEGVFNLRYAKNLEKALKHAFELVGRDSKVLISPNASTTLVELKNV